MTTVKAQETQLNQQKQIKTPSCVISTENVKINCFLIFFKLVSQTPLQLRVCTAHVLNPFWWIRAKQIEAKCAPKNSVVQTTCGRGNARCVQWQWQLASDNLNISGSGKAVCKFWSKYLNLNLNEKFQRVEWMLMAWQVDEDLDDLKDVSAVPVQVSVRLFQIRIRINLYQDFFKYQHLSSQYLCSYVLY